MISPQEQSHILIDITNHCNSKCSNCNRFVGHYKESQKYFMSFQCFQNAVDSLVDFEGLIGITGGDPLLHPEFDKFVKYFAEKINNVWRRGLWCSNPKTYFEKYELIHNVFSKVQFLKDRENELKKNTIKPSFHNPYLISPKDIIKDQTQLWTLINNCPVQRTSASTITHKGAFVCEIMGAFDNLYNGPGGIKIKKNWWKIKPDDKQFKDQVQRWCVNCSGCIPNKLRASSDIKDDISQFHFDKLKSQSKKIKDKLFQKFDESNYDLQKILNAKRNGSLSVIKNDKDHELNDNDKIKNIDDTTILEDQKKYRHETLKLYKKKNEKILNHINKKLIICVPYRNREQHYKIFLEHMKNYFIYDHIARYINVKIVFTEQENDKPFNLGKLNNICFLENQNDCDYFVINNVDFLPIFADYTYNDKPTVLISKGHKDHPIKPFDRDKIHVTLNAPSQKYVFYGSVLLPSHIFKEVNGYSNNFWGWGFEDTDMRERLNVKKIEVDYRDGFYQPLHHETLGYNLDENDKIQKTEINLKNHNKYDENWKDKNYFLKDGYTFTEYKKNSSKIIFETFREGSKFTIEHLKVDL